jgi:hypothetical protein
MPHVDLLSEDRIALKMRATVRKLHYTGRRRSVRYVATLGNVEAIADTEAEAKGALAAIVEQACADLTAPLIIYDLVERDTVWIAAPGAYGWGYTITRRAPEIGPHYSRSTSLGGFWTREDCYTHMKAHWYAQNAELIVNGIVALCSSWREWVCPKCATGQRAHAPYVCRNPACGHETQEAQP